jgi:methylglutaconyl-CoA hydratase
VSTVLKSEVDGVRTLTLNRPEHRNAMTPAMQTELIAALESAGESASTRVLVLTGAGDCFCAGLDLHALQAMQSKQPMELADDAHRIARIFRTLYELPLPTIAQVNGHAIAGGTGLATMCDFTLAVPSAKFGYTETKIGFVPAIVSAYLMLQIGDKRARDLLLTGRLFSAAEAHALGLVSEVVAPEELPARVHALAHTLAANSPTSLRATKRLLAEQNRHWLDKALELALKANAAARETDDFREGIAAFLEKRKPVWT